MGKIYNFITYFFICFVRLGFTSRWHSIDHMATFHLNWCMKTWCVIPCIISDKNGHLSRTIDVPTASLTWKNQKFLSRFEPTSVAGKWLEVHGLNHSTKDSYFYYQSKSHILKQHASTFILFLKVEMYLKVRYHQVNKKVIYTLKTVFTIHINYPKEVKTCIGCSTQYLI
jgi:hypothetical protein